jgi:hypothetical protein
VAMAMASPQFLLLFYRGFEIANSAADVKTG